MGKAERIRKQNEKISNSYKGFTDRQMLEMIMYNLKWLGISIFIIILLLVFSY